MTISIGRAWDETRDILARDGSLIATVSAALLMVPSAVYGLVVPQASSMAAEVAEPTAFASLLQIAVIVLGQVGVLALAAIALRRRESVGHAIRQAFGRVLPLIGATLLYAVPMLFLVAFVLGAMVGGETPEAMLANLQNVSGSAVLALTILFIASLVIGVRLIFLVPVLMSENGGAIAAMKRSWALTRGATPRLLLFVLLWAVTGIIVLISASSIAGIVITLTVGTVEPLTVGALIAGLTGGLVNAFIVTIYALMIARLYAQRVTVDTVPHVQDIFN